MFNTTLNVSVDLDIPEGFRFVVNFSKEPYEIWVELEDIEPKLLSEICKQFAIELYKKAGKSMSPQIKES